MEYGNGEQRSLNQVMASMVSKDQNFDFNRTKYPTVPHKYICLVVVVLSESNI